MKYAHCETGTIVLARLARETTFVQSRYMYCQHNDYLICPGDQQTYSIDKVEVTHKLVARKELVEWGATYWVRHDNKVEERIYIYIKTGRSISPTAANPSTNGMRYTTPRGYNEKGSGIPTP